MTDYKFSKAVCCVLVLFNHGKNSQVILMAETQLARAPTQQTYNPMSLYTLTFPIIRQGRRVYRLYNDVDSMVSIETSCNQVVNF